MKCAKYLLSASAAAAAVGLLWKTKEVSEGVRAGLGSCAAVIIPSLFPFMILAGLIAATQAGAVLSRAVSGFTRRVIGMPENLGAVLLMSFVGGFPVGRADALRHARAPGDRPGNPPSAPSAAA